MKKYNLQFTNVELENLLNVLHHQIAYDENLLRVRESKDDAFNGFLKSRIIYCRDLIDRVNDLVFPL